MVKSIGYAFTLLGLIGFSSLPLYSIAQISIVPTATPIALYFVCFTGALLVMWGQLLLNITKQSDFYPAVIKLTVLLLVLLAVMRLFAITLANELFSFLPEAIALTLPASEVILFFTLAAMLHRQTKTQEHDHANT